jgi:dihydroneopterin aldolase
MSDRIAVRGLTLFAHLGALEGERAIGQRFMLDLVIETDFTAAAASGDVADTIDYGEVVEIATAAFLERTEALIEVLAVRVAERILARFPRAMAAEVTVRKPGAPVAAIFDWAEVTARRSR